MLDLAYDNIETTGMMPEEFKNKDIPEFSLRVNVPRMLSVGKRTNNKVFDHYNNQGKKSFPLRSCKRGCSLLQVPLRTYSSALA